MLHYLLNTTCIWLLCLALFDLLLAAETHHTLNRVYLLLSLLLGICIPLLHWSPVQGITNGVQPIYMLKEAIVTSATVTKTADWLGILTTLYLAGALVASAVLATDVWKLVRLYKNSKKHIEGIWTIAETRESHTPFSFGNWLFVQDRSAFSAAEWSMLCSHERVHTASVHFADVLLLQLVRIVFWFHPLVYIYYNRLRMVHEYEADAQARRQATTYSTFLVEQAMLHPAPSITHSFNRSPIKKRIIMLGKNSSPKSKLKFLVLLPLSVALVTCFSAGAQQRSKEDATVCTTADVMPKSGYDLTNYLIENVKYPDDARKKKTEGKVIVKFVVGKDGQVSNVTVKKSVDPALDAEAKRVVSKMPRWQPGTKNGKPVSVYFYLPIAFRLS